MTDIKVLEKLAEQELRQANSKFPQFHSLHEGYAVIKEEMEETAEDLDKVKWALSNVWRNIRENDSDYLGNPIEAIKIHALNTAAEAIQVAAMAQKMINFLEGQNHE